MIYKMNTTVRKYKKVPMDVVLDSRAYRLSLGNAVERKRLAKEEELQNLVGLIHERNLDEIDHATQERQYKEHQLEGLDFELIDALRELACSEQADKDLKELWKRDFKMIKETEENGVDWYISEDF